MASYKASARSLDQGVGAVLNALDEHDIADDTLVILTTDHGLAFPGAKATLTDRGIGVLLIMRGPGGFHGGRVSEALVSQIDIYPTICELIGLERAGLPPGPLAAAGHAQARPTRSTTRSSPSSRTTPPTSRSGRSGPSAGSTSAGSATATCRCSRTSTTGRPRTCSWPSGWAERPLPREALYDLLFDPAEAHNLADDPAHAGVLAEMQGRLDAWMRDTDDPLLDGDVDAAARRGASTTRTRSPPRIPTACCGSFRACCTRRSSVLDEMNALPARRRTRCRSPRRAPATPPRPSGCAARASRSRRSATWRRRGRAATSRSASTPRSRPTGVVAYIHGGGWIMGTLDSYDAPLTRLANAAGATVASIDYRLAPEHRFPAAVDDCLAAIRWIASQHDESVATARLAVAGDSAGGNLAAVAARRLRGELAAAAAGADLPGHRRAAQPAVAARVRRGLRAQRGAAAARLERLPRRRRRRRTRTRRRCARAISKASRPRSSSPPRPTSCATRARPTRPRCGTRACPSSSCAGRA